MTLSTESQTTESTKAVDSYLMALRKQLRELTDEDANDIVEEIRMHILDKTCGDVQPETIRETLAALGTPAELANKYCTEEMLARGRAARSPAYVARSAGRWALLTVVGLVVFLLSVVGYGFGGFLFMVGLLKIFNPGGTGVYGVWTDHEKSFNWGSGPGPNRPGELLGLWLIPIGLLVGGGLLLLTFQLGRWSLRKFWRPRKWQEF
jgi:hypothetical protein